MNDAKQVIVESNTTDVLMDPSLLKEYNKRETIILIYRVVTILVGLLLVYLGYELFTSAVIDPNNIKNYRFERDRVLPGAVLCFSGLAIILMGVTRLMPLPGSKKLTKQTGTEPPVLLEEHPGDGIPVLTQDGFRPNEDLLWKNNVKPLLAKVAGNELISHSDRELLQKWLQTLETH